MNKALFLLILLFTSCLTGVYAQVEDKPPITGKLNGCVELKATCSNCTYVNLTGVDNPDGTAIFSGNIRMQNVQPGVYNTSFCSTSKIGLYTYHVLGDPDGIKDIDSPQFEITPSGYTSTTSFFFLFILIIVLVYILGFKLENTWIVEFASILILIFGFFIIKNGLDIIRDTQTTWAIGLIAWGIGLYSLYLCVEEQLKNWR